MTQLTQNFDLSDCRDRKPFFLVLQTDFLEGELFLVERLGHPLGRLEHRLEYLAVSSFANLNGKKEIVKEPYLVDPHHICVIFSNISIASRNCRKGKNK